MEELDGNIIGNISVVNNGLQSLSSNTSTTLSNYSRGTTVLSSELRVGPTSTLSGTTIVNGPVGTSPVVVGASNGSNNAVLKINGIAFNNPITIAAGSTGEAGLAAIGSAPTYVGTITLQRSVFLTGSAIFTGTITGDGSISIDNAGLGNDGGTTDFYTKNSYTGSTFIGTGVLRTDAVNLLPSGTAVTIANGYFNSFNLNNYNQAIGSIAEGSGGDTNHGALLLGTATLTTGGDNTNTTFGGIVTGTGGITKTGMRTFNLSGSSTYTGPTSVSSGIVVLSTAAGLASTSLIVARGALMAVGGSLSSNASINVNGAMVFNGSNTLSTIQTKVSLGFNNGQWNAHTGFSSSAAASDPHHFTALGVIQNNQSGTAIYTSTKQFEGYTPGTADVLVKNTYYGDANLDGRVDGSDYSRIDSGYLTHATGWFNGDFNYDNVINGSDYTLIDNGFNAQGAQLTSQIAPPSAVVSAEIAAAASVPEPTAIAVVALAMSGLPGRCSRRRHIAEAGSARTG